MSNPNKELTHAPGYPDLLVDVRPFSKGHVVLHIGFAEDLLVTGVATADMLAPRDKKDRRGRMDADGHQVEISRYFVVRNGEPVSRYRIRRLGVPFEKALCFIGVRETLNRRWVEYKGGDSEFRSIPQEAPPTTTPRKCDYLRLVVDNTKGVSP